MLCTIYYWRQVCFVNVHTPYLFKSARVLMTNAVSHSGANIDSCDLQRTLQLIKLYSGDQAQTNIQYNRHIPTKLQLLP